MDENLIKFLKTCKLFAGLEVSDAVYHALASQFEKLSLKENEYLFNQGDTPEYFYILVSGKLAASLHAQHAKPKVVGYISPGEAVGEMGALSGDPRSLDIIAVEKCLLLKLPCETFRKLCRQYPSVMYETISPMVNRSREVIKALSTTERKKHIAIIPANKDVNLHVFEEQFRTVLEHYKKAVLLSEAELKTTNNPDSVEEIIKTAEANNHMIIYLLQDHETPLSKACWNKLGKIYVVGRGNTKPNYSPYVLDKLQSMRHLVEVRRELILLYKEGIQPQQITFWLQHANYYQHHHVEERNLADYQRIMRFMRGKAVGLVLSGGGARGWAQIGALQALVESNIPIDAVGGTSAGAIIGSLYARNKNMKMIYEEFGSILEKTRQVVSWRNICWPAISLFDCKAFTEETQSLYQNLLIEQLSLPFFCVTCNLSSYKEAVHRSGLLWEKMRASTAVPGLVPPMIIDGDLHIDGGVSNNLPVNVMREMLGTESKIIAVELISRVPTRSQYNFPPTITFKEAFLSKLRLGYRQYRFPPFLDTFIKALLVGSSVKQDENALAANLLIKPHTGKYSMLKVSDRQKEELIRIGYKTTMRQLEGWDVKK